MWIATKSICCWCNISLFAHPKRYTARKSSWLTSRRVLQPVLIEADAAPLDWCEPLEQILKTLDDCHSLRDMMEHGLLEQGRLLKDSAGDMFYDPAALVAFCRFNFSLRRAFIRMLHADLNAVKTAVDTLEAAGVKSVDCRRAGFSAAETTARLRYYSENWRQPFHKDYTESSVSRAFEQLLALRADLEEAVARMHDGFTPATGSATPAKVSSRPELAAPAKVTEIKSGAALANQSPRTPLDLAGIGEPAPTNALPPCKVSRRSRTSRHNPRPNPTYRPQTRPKWRNASKQSGSS